MPLITVKLHEGRSLEQKRELELESSPLQEAGAHIAVTRDPTLSEATIKIYWLRLFQDFIFAPPTQSNHYWIGYREAIVR